MGHVPARRFHVTGSEHDMWLTDLADACRSSGLAVKEVDGWQTRGHGGMVAVRGIVCHHTAGAPTGDYPSLAIVRDSPLAQLGLGRSGTVYVIAAGECWHAGKGSWPGLSGNSDCIGIEGESVGLRDDWTPAQRNAWPRLCGALAQHYRIPARLVIAHREWAPTRKIDPAYINMNQLRAGLILPSLRGFLMALTDAEQTEILTRVRAIEEVARGTYNKAAIGGDITAQNRATLAGQDTALDAIGTDTVAARTMLSEQADMITTAITAAIREATGGGIEEAVVRQAVHDAVSSLTIVLPDDGAA